MPARTLYLALLFGAALPSAAPAVAAPLQDMASSPSAATSPSAPTVDQYLCTFAGKCDGAAVPEQVTRDAPETRGFRLARPTADTHPAAVTSPTSASRSRGAFRMPSAHAGHAPRANYVSRQADYGSGVAATRSANLTSPAVTGAGSGAGLGRHPRADLMIGFELNSDRLSADGMTAARTFARSLQMPELAGKRFLIEGHTDLRGGRALNASLSARRAQAVANFLAGEGVARDRLQTRGFGASVPLPGHRVTDPANRRVEAELIS